MRGGDFNKRLSYDVEKNMLHTGFLFRSRCIQNSILAPLLVYVEKQYADCIKVLVTKWDFNQQLPLRLILKKIKHAKNLIKQR
jgi:hypothetical protein